jgi:hypothetical protein
MKVVKPLKPNAQTRPSNTPLVNNMSQIESKAYADNLFSSLNKQIVKKPLDDDKGKYMNYGGNKGRKAVEEEEYKDEEDE